MTSYDTIFGQFITISQTDSFNIPTDPTKQYDLIHTAIRKFNNKLNDTIGWDDTTELTNRELTDSEILIIANYLKLVFIENQLIYFVTLWRAFAKELGQVTYKSQVDALKELVKEQKNEIEQLVMSEITDYSGG